jgi:CRP-like cAMP-binding protein/Zn-dependent protease
LGQAVAIVVGVLLIGAAGFLVGEGWRQRRRARTALDVFALVADGLAFAPSDSVPGSVFPASSPGAPPGTGTDLWEDLADRLDVSAFRPKLAEDVEIRIFKLRWGKDYAIAANPRDLLHLTLEVWEAELAGRMDGTRTVADLIVERLDEDGDLDADAVIELVQVFASTGFLEPREVDFGQLLANALEPEGFGRRLHKFAKTFTIEWRGADACVRVLYRAGVRWFFKPAVGVLISIVAVVGLVLFVAVQREGYYTLSTRAAPLDSLLLIMLGWVLTFAHELGHASVLIHKGRRIKNAGFMLYFGSPAFFVDSSDGLMLDANARILQSFAGPFAEMVLSGASSILLFFLPQGPLGELLYRFSLLNYFVILLNLVPLLELDGYWILSDFIQMPDLRPRSLEFTQHDLWHKLRKRERFSRQEVGLAAYGIAGVAFTIFAVLSSAFFWRQTFGNLILSLWRGGVVSQILLAVLVLFIGGPAVRGLAKLGRAVYRRVRSLGRVIRFRLETGWRVEASELIDALPAFEDLPTEVLSDLSGRVGLRNIRPGQAVVRQGERATAFYVVRRGTFNVETEDPETGDTEHLRTLGRGDSFGEIGLLKNTRRQATVRALTEGEVFEIDKGTFDRLLADPIRAPEFGPTLQALAELRELPAFGHLGTDRLAGVLAHGGWVSFAPGETLMNQGEVGDAFFAIAAGQADVLVDGELVDSIGVGSHAGEVALLRHVPRTATVAARTPLRAFRLDREGFDALIAEAFTNGTLRAATRRTWEH